MDARAGARCLRFTDRLKKEKEEDDDDMQTSTAGVSVAQAQRHAEAWLNLAEAHGQQLWQKLLDLEALQEAVPRILMEIRLEAQSAAMHDVENALEASPRCLRTIREAVERGQEMELDAVDLQPAMATINALQSLATAVSCVEQSIEELQNALQQGEEAALRPEEMERATKALEKLRAREAAFEALRTANGIGSLRQALQDGKQLGLSGKDMEPFSKRLEELIQATRAQPVRERDSGSGCSFGADGREWERPFRSSLSIANGKRRKTDSAAPRQSHQASANSFSETTPTWSWVWWNDVKTLVLAVNQIEERLLQDGIYACQMHVCKDFSKKTARQEAIWIDAVDAQPLLPEGSQCLAYRDHTWTAPVCAAAYGRTTDVRIRGLALAMAVAAAARGFVPPWQLKGCSYADGEFLQFVEECRQRLDDL